MFFFCFACGTSRNQTSHLRVFSFFRLAPDVRNGRVRPPTWRECCNFKIGCSRSVSLLQETDYIQYLFVSVAGILLNESYHIISCHTVSYHIKSYHVSKYLIESYRYYHYLRQGWETEHHGWACFFLHLIPSTVSLLGIPQGFFLQIQPFPAENSTKRPFLMLTCNVENHFFGEPLEHDILVGEWRYPEIHVSLNLEISLIRKTTTTLTPFYQLNHVCQVDVKHENLGTWNPPWL